MMNRNGSGLKAQTASRTSCVAPIFSQLSMTVYDRSMIKSFRHKGSRRLYDEAPSSGINADQAEKLTDILAAPAAADEPSDVGLFPGWRLHALKGDLKGFWSVTVSGNWRLIFRFEKGDAFDVDLIDYH